MANVPVNIFRSVVRRQGARPSQGSVTEEEVTPVNPVGTGAIPDENKVSYNQADNKSSLEQAQARQNIDVFSKAEVKDITGFRVNLNTQSKDNLVQAINETNTWTVVEW